MEKVLLIDNLVQILTTTRTYGNLVGVLKFEAEGGTKVLCAKKSRTKKMNVIQYLKKESQCG